MNEIVYCHRWKARQKVEVFTCDDTSSIFDTAWVNYYGRFHGSRLGKVWWNLNWILYRWYRNKYKKHSKSKRRSWAWINRIIKKEPTLFRHWEVTYQHWTIGRQEPYESRGSRTVLWERGGETPLRYLTVVVILHSVNFAFILNLTSQFQGTLNFMILSKYCIDVEY